ncbi:ATP-binding protein [Cohnella caldifontis]|uniref:ATP-binding protein n=1 Tax=Cohnella caldifontis TaxID=3027471 RepID=UPI0023EC9D13|nr:ATP-binding protein [Cohnella sp. YIM B05605]
MSKSRRLAGWIGITLLLVDVGCAVAVQGDLYLETAASGVLQALASLYAAVLLTLASLRSAEEKYWRCYAASAYFFFVAQSIWLAEYFLTGQVSDRIGAPEVLWSLQYVFILTGLYFQRKSMTTPTYPFIFDILLFTTVSLALYWQLFIQPKPSGFDPSEALTLYHLFGSSVNLVILTFLMIFGWPRATKGIRNLLIAAFLLRTVSSSFSWFLEGRPHWQGFGLELTDFCWFASFLCLGFAGMAKGTADPKAPAIAGTASPKRYFPLVVGGLLLVLLLAGSYPATPVTLACLIGVALMLIRLFLGIRESEAVYRSLWETNQTYRNWTENALVGVFIEQDDRIVFVNRHFEEIFGYERGQMLGRSILSHISMSDVPKFLAEVGKLQENLPTTRFEVNGFRKDQSLLYLEIHLSKTYFQGKSSLSGTLVDITERRMSEQYLIRSEKLSVVGQLAAGVAHEIRNPLTALKGFTQLLHQNSDDNRKYYEIMLAELERINYIVGEFMMLSKPHNRQQLKEHDLHRILMSIIPILESQAILHNVMIRIEPPRQLPMVKCDENQIKQVLINLMKNAIEAMPGGGTVTVRFENDAPKRELTVQIDDQGVGMPPEILERLGEPFLTTKEKGTGLGLMVCYKIIQAHEGRMSVSSQPGQGTSIQLVLPAR